MKKLLLLSPLLIILLCSPALAADMEVSRVPFDVTVNEQIIGADDEYPPLYHNGIVYLPTTFNMNSFVGLRVEFYPNYTVADEKIGSIFVGLDKITADHYTAYPLTAKDIAAARQENVIVVNACHARDDIKNSAREHPFINYKNVLYMPLTHDIAVEKLDWALSFSSENGLTVDTRNPNWPILDAAHSAVVGFSRPPMNDVTLNYVYSEGAYAAYPSNTFAGIEFRYKAVGEEEIRNKISFPDGDYYFNSKTTTGKDVFYDTDCVASVTDEGILKMPAVIKKSIGGEYIGKNIYLTIDVKNGRILEIEDLP